MTPKLVDLGRKSLIRTRNKDDPGIMVAVTVIKLKMNGMYFGLKMLSSFIEARPFSILTLSGHEYIALNKLLCRLYALSTNGVAIVFDIFILEKYEI